MLRPPRSGSRRRCSYATVLQAVAAVACRTRSRSWSSSRAASSRTLRGCVGVVGSQSAAGALVGVGRKPGPDGLEAGHGLVLPHVCAPGSRRRRCCNERRSKRTPGAARIDDGGDDRVAAVRRSSRRRGRPPAEAGPPPLRTSDDGRSCRFSSTRVGAGYAVTVGRARRRRCRRAHSRRPARDARAASPPAALAEPPTLPRALRRACIAAAPPVHRRPHVRPGPALRGCAAAPASSPAAPPPAPAPPPTRAAPPAPPGAELPPLPGVAVDPPPPQAAPATSSANPTRASPGARGHRDMARMLTHRRTNDRSTATSSPVACADLEDCIAALPLPDCSVAVSGRSLSAVVPAPVG